ncbi:MAG TPA: MFS transporter [Rhizomicrobium sp.]|nr:MFS transporter [Rhizomicrobium sp.]
MSSGKRYPYVVLAMLALTYILNFADRQILTVLIEPVKAELGLSDTMIGLLTGTAFALFYVTIGIPIGWLADRSNRIRIIAGACLLWSLFTAACGMAGSTWQLAIARMGVGVGEAGGTPPALSIISDYFPKERRAFAVSIYTVGAPIGVFLGTALGGWVAAAFGWRMAFIVVAAFGVVVAPLLLLVVREPVRGRFEAKADGVVADSPAPLSETVRRFYRYPSLGLLALASGLSAFVGYGLLNWLPAFLMRVRGMSVMEVGSYYSVVAGATLAAGTLIGGILVSRFCTRYPRAYSLVPSLAFVVAAPLFVAAVLVPSWEWALLLIALPLVMINVFVAPALALVQNLVPANARSVTSAMLMLVLNLVGLGMGPFAVGAISDAFTPSFGAGGLQIAMLFLAPMMLLAAAAHYAVSRFVENDLRRAEAG